MDPASLVAMTHASAAYVARYSLKKVTGKRADDHYWRVSPVDGRRIASRLSFSRCRAVQVSGRRGLKFGKDAFSASVVVSSPFPNRVGRVASVSEGVMRTAGRLGRLGSIWTS